jgi:class 3 adenylate cyclase/CheY-like chemotaxis protein
MFDARDISLGGSLSARAAMSSASPAVLVVDDNEDNRYTLELLLQADGYSEVASACGGEEALALIRERPFSLVLLDMMMPDLNGDEVLRIIKGSPDTRDIAVVMISADTDSDKISKCIELGADDYLPKPFNPAILRARIASALRRQSLREMETQYLTRIEQDKRRSEMLLHNVLPPEIAHRLISGEGTIADHHEEATVLFADIIGFGKITARMRPFEIVGSLNRLFSEFDRVAEDVGVERIKTIGDNYMAVVGVPTPRANHARVAARLALDLIAAAEGLHTRLPAQFSIRVGLHSGPLMAGVIGMRRYAYDVWGDTVNIAARIEAASKPNRVLASAATASMLGSEFVLEGPQRVETKEERVLDAFFIGRRR